MEVLTPADVLARQSRPEPLATKGQSPTATEKFRSYVELTKPRITFLVVLSALAGFCMGSAGSVDYLGLLHTVLGVALLSSGISTLNQYLERDSDALMKRTRNRPLPAGRLTAASALWFGIALSVVSTAYLALLVNPLTAAWGMAALGSYLFLYTPLKQRTTLCTFIGAFPGALPPLLGWTAARNEMGIEALVLFAILFLWQFPHFHAIATMYRDDYARAGIRMLPVIDRDYKATAREIVIYAAVLLPVSLLPTLLNMSGKVYFVAALILGAMYLKGGIATAQAKTPAEARRLLRTSVLYLPLLFLVMVLNR
ncbi:MAG TPA: heme o synthase [Blastocatellia bacterium]|nr:heme o synthase [Blastocatellia bacterium]